MKKPNEKPQEKLVVQWLPADQLKPYQKNAKRHPESQIKKLAKHIQDNGWDQPIVTDERFAIIKGHGRLLAAQALGLKLVPVLVRSGLTKEQVRAMRIADNRLAETEWDVDLLIDELSDLKNLNVDIDSIGFSTKELDAMRAAKEGTTPAGGGGNDVIQYQIVFDTPEQQARFYHFVKWLKREYPDQETIAERLDLHIQKLVKV